MSLSALIRATETLKKREGDVLPTLKTIFFEGLKTRYNSKIINNVLIESKGGSWGNDHFSGSIKAKVLRSPDIRFGCIDYKNAEERFFTKKEIEKYNLKNNDILVIKSNGSLDLVGKSQLYKTNEDYPYVIASNFLMVLSPNEELIYPEYLDLFLKSPEALVWRFDTQKTTTGLRNLNSKGFLNIEIPVPDTVQEQVNLFNEFSQIVEGKINKHEVELRRFYSLSNDKIKLSTELTHQQELLKQLRHSLLREAMQGKLVKQEKKDGNAKELLQKIIVQKEKLIAEGKLKKEKPLPPIKEEEIPFDIPENWVWCRLNDVCIHIVDCPHSTPNYLSSETGYFGIDTTCIDDSGNIVRLRHLSKESYQDRIKRLVPTENDIVYAREGSIGLAAFIPKGKKICLGQRVMLFRSSSEIDSTFLKMVVSDEAYKNRLLEKYRGMGAKHVNVKDIVSSLIPLPPIAEQKRIVNKLEKVMNLCDELNTTITNNKNYADQLLQVALKDALQLK